MAKLNIPFGIVRDDVVAVTSVLSVTFSKKEVEEIEAVFAKSAPKRLVADLPEPYFKRLCNKAYKVAPQLARDAQLNASKDTIVAFPEDFPNFE